MMRPPSSKPKPKSTTSSNANTSSFSTTTAVPSSANVNAKKQKKPSESIECIARRFLHDFTADSSSSDVHDADHAAWWAGSLRKHAKSASTSSPTGVENQNGRTASKSRPNSSSRSQTEQQQQNENSALIVSPPSQQRSSKRLHKNKNDLHHLENSDVEEQIVYINDAGNNNNNNRQRQAQLTAFARDGCGTILNPAASSKCNGHRKWDPSVAVVAADDPLYALLHKRLQQEGFADDFEAAQEKFRKRVSKAENDSRKEDNARKDRELQWYLEVYRPKQKREGLCEVESDTRLEISEEEMTAFMRLKQKFWEITRSIQQREQRQQQKEQAERLAEQRRRENDERLLKEWLSRMQKQLMELEQVKRKELSTQHENTLCNMYEHSHSERERMAKLRLAQINRLKAEASNIFVSEQDRRKSILALEATAAKHLAQCIITERAEMFISQRQEIQQECSRVRKETGRAEIDERSALLRDLIIGTTILNGLREVEKQEVEFRKKINHDRNHEMGRFEKAAELSRKDANDTVFMQSAQQLEKELFEGRNSIMKEHHSILTREIYPSFVGERNEIMQALYDSLEKLQQDARDGIVHEYHHFLVYRARHEATAINIHAEQTEIRFNIVEEEHEEIRELIRNSLITSAQLREQSERQAVLREEHQAASRLAVEAAIVRDCAASERRDYFARQLIHVEKEEQDSRHDFVADRLETLSRMIDDCIARLGELNRAQEAKLLQQALRLTSNFVGIGLAERGDYLQVETLTEFGPGQQAGLRLGDQVLAIGGIPVSSTLEMRSALKRTGFVSKNLEVLVRRFIPENPENFEKNETIRIDTPLVEPTARPKGKFLDDVEKVSLLVSTTEAKFRQFPFYFDSKKNTTRLCLQLASSAATSNDASKNNSNDDNDDEEM